MRIIICLILDHKAIKKWKQCWNGFQQGFQRLTFLREKTATSYESVMATDIKENCMGCQELRAKIVQNIGYHARQTMHRLLHLLLLIWTTESICISEEGSGIVGETFLAQSRTCSLSIMSL